MPFRLRMVSGLLASALLVVFTATATAWASVKPAQKASKVTNINIGYVPYANDSSLFLGMKKGFFRQRGLNVTVTPQATPLAVISSMESGQEQFGFVTSVILVNAVVQGTSIKCVANVDGNQTPNPKQDGTVLVSAPHSGITSVKQLAGKTVGIVQLHSLNSLSIDLLAKKAGINPTSVKQLQIPFPQMPEALTTGKIDAAIIVSPFLQSALSNGAHAITHPEVDLFPGASTVCFAATSGYLKSHSGVAKSFAAAMAKSITYSKTHQREAAATLPQYHLATSVENALSEKLGTDWSPAINLSSIAYQEKVMKDYGVINTIPPVRQLVWTPK